MSLLGAVPAAIRAWRTQRLAPDRLRRLQDRKLRRLVRHAYRTVPYYRRLFEAAGLAPGDIRSLDDLSAVPITPAGVLVRQPLETILSHAFRRAALVPERTTGTSGVPFTAYYDRRFLGIRNAAFLRGLMAAGYRPGRRLLLITDRLRGTQPWLRWDYVLLTEPPERMLESLVRTRPWGVYGCMTPLRQLARLITRSGARIPPLGAVISTAELLDEATRALLRQAFGAEVFDCYGLTEMGLVGWECAEHTGYHLSEDVVAVELLPSDRAEWGRLVLTNLELFAMPFIRVDSGDLARPGPPGPCDCGRTLRRVSGFDGRTFDCVQLPDGRVLTPYHVTLALKAVPRVGRYQVVQSALDSFLVRLEGDQPGADADAEAVRRALRAVVGAEARVAVEWRASLDPPPGRKFRTVTCDLPLGPR